MRTEMDLPEPNIPLLRKAIEWAEVEATKPWDECLWLQTVYCDTEVKCGTAYCIAGYTVSIQPGFQGEDAGYAQLDGVRVQWDDAAAGLLGIAPGEANQLFDGDNTIQDVRRFAEQIAERVGERL